MAEHLTHEDIHYLLFAERWMGLTKEARLSLETVIKVDKGRNFPSILTEDDLKVKTFSMEDIPEADVLLVYGNCPRALVYVAEIAIRYRRQYHKYPEFISLGDGRGMFKNRTLMSEWFQNQMIELNFDPEWILKNDFKPLRRDFSICEELKRILPLVILPKGRKTKVLAVTGIGNSMVSAQELSARMPEVEFFFFENPQVSDDERIFYDEIFSPDTYAVDCLIAAILDARTSITVPLPIEKMIDIPSTKYLIQLVKKGYCGYLSTKDYWSILGFDWKKGREMYETRILELQKSTRRDLEDKTRAFLMQIRKYFRAKKLHILAYKK